MFFFAIGTQDCVQIVTGTSRTNGDDGTLQVSINNIKFQSRKFRLGELVIDICFSKLDSISLINPTNDIWAGAITYTKGGIKRQLLCNNCNSDLSQGKLVVGGSREGTNHGVFVVPNPGL